MRNTIMSRDHYQEDRDFSVWHCDCCQSDVTHLLTAAQHDVFVSLRLKTTGHRGNRVGTRLETRERIGAGCVAGRIGRNSGGHIFGRN